MALTLALLTGNQTGDTVGGLRSADDEFCFVLPSPLHECGELLLLLAIPPLCGGSGLLDMSLQL